MRDLSDRCFAPRRPLLSLVLIAVGGIVTAAAGGCNRGPVYHKVTGVVRVAGKPVEGIQVSFYLDDPTLPLASGLTNEDGWFALYSGTYAVEGCQAGKARVVFGYTALDTPNDQDSEAPGSGDGPADQGVSSSGLELPPNMPQPPFALEYYYPHTTPVRYEVKEDAEVEFDLLEFGSTEVPKPPQAEAEATGEPAGDTAES